MPSNARPHQLVCPWVSTWREGIGINICQPRRNVTRQGLQLSKKKPELHLIGSLWEMEETVAVEDS